MINLLPPEVKDDYRYARRSSALVRVLASFGVGIAGLAMIVTFGFLYLHQTANSYQIRATDTERSLRQQKQAEIEKQVQDISNSLKLSVQVLSQEVLFSELLRQLAVVTPSNVRLSGVAISEFGGGIDVSAEATDYTAATQLQVNLADPANKIFSKADIVSITCETAGTDDSAYPCTLTVRALFAADNPFLFINGNSQAGG